jgi:hypothetical protein
MSRDLLKLALEHPELARKKIAYARKKRAAMIKEAPYKKEYSLTKKANASRKLTDLAYRLGVKKPNAGHELAYGGLRYLPPMAGHVGGAVGGHMLFKEIAPMLGVKGFYGAHTTPEILASLGLSAATFGAGAHVGEKLLNPVGKKLSKRLMPETSRYMRISNPYKLASLTKEAGLSRAAKGAIGLPAAALALGPIAAATHMPGIADDMISQLAKTTGNLEGVPGLFKTLYGPLRVPSALGIGDSQILSGDIIQRAAQSLAGLSALGAGAGKLSEKIIPVAKKSVTDKPTARGAAMAAALFPWTLAAGGGAYLLGKSNSDS